ncbi:cysteine hydrolase family protein [Anaerosporobacter faecicola]|uniref:cysteine hydrolase family protein n=1 Tax=Anaerosporobacter faecicola TaxID=2718714 RepID=UPI00143A3FF4|nr:cysteine hydrolase family protein [Anaerosporobacter faecicola]
MKTSKKRVLLIIDVQYEYLDGGLPIVDSDQSLPRIHQSIQIAKEHDIPVVLIQHLCPPGQLFGEGGHTADLEETLLTLPHDQIIQKRKPSSFSDTTLESYLKEIGCDTVVIAGYMTHMCCDSTARDAYHMGYDVEFLSDATGTINLTSPQGTVDAHLLHDTVLAIQSSMFSTVLSVDEWKNSLE